jgi:hypothetical protein
MAFAQGTYVRRKVLGRGSVSWVRCKRMRPRRTAPIAVELLS